MSQSSDILVPLRELSHILLELRSKLYDTLDLIIISLIVFVLLNLLLYFFIHKVSDDDRDSKFRLFRRTKLPENVTRTLIVTAHPDDECMFFGPTLISLRKRKNCKTYLLCLSNGNFENEGRRRKQELWDSCEVLGIDASNITLFNCTLLPDNPKVEWKAELLSDIIKVHAESLDIDLLITFDRDGVSHHRNHQALYFATASLYLTGALPAKCKVMVLSTVNVVRKYLSLFDILLSMLISSNWTILKWGEMKAVQAAMERHKSQMLWFRKLYIRFSRYMIVNTLTELNRETIQFDFIG